MNGRDELENWLQQDSMAQPNTVLSDLDIVESLSNSELHRSQGGKSFWHSVGHYFTKMAEANEQTGGGM